MSTADTTSLASLKKRPRPSGDGLGHSRRHGLLSLACCLGIALIGGCSEQQATSYPLLLVKVQPVKLVNYTPKVTLTGEISARVQSDLSFRVGGRIIERKVEVGTHVESGEVLARLDPKVQEADVEGAIAGVQSAEAKLRQVTSNFERQQELLKTGFTTQRDYDQAEQEYRSAQALLDSAKAQLSTARDNLAQTVLSAPSPGIITARNAEIGQVAQPSQPVFALAHDGPRDAIVNVQESIITGGFKEDIEIALVSDPKIKARGEVREVSPALNQAGAVRVKIAIMQPPPEMVLGAAVRVSAHAQPREMAVLPWSALYSEGGKPAVWVVDPKTKEVALRRIGIEAYGNSDIVMRDGLRPGELVVTVGTQLLRPAQRVAFAGEGSS
ncbi:MAG: efflux RND transporter periplasmic adaptor subunit [Rhodomicrobium sp.]